MAYTAIYTRTSTYGQNHASQKREIDRWIAAHGLSATYFIDHATGDNLDRPGFQRLQQAIFNGEVSTVVVYKLDRLSRSLRDGVNILTDWLDRGIRVVATSQGHDFSGPTGKLIASVLLSVAEMEQETRRERQAAGIAAAKERGIYLGRKVGTRKVDPSKVRDLKARGLSNAEIAKITNVSTKTVARYLAQQQS